MTVFAVDSPFFDHICSTYTCILFFILQGVVYESFFTLPLTTHGSCPLLQPPFTDPKSCCVINISPRIMK